MGRPANIPATNQRCTFAAPRAALFEYHSQSGNGNDPVVLGRRGPHARGWRWDGVASGFWSAPSLLPIFRLLFACDHLINLSQVPWVLVQVVDFT